MKKSPIIKLLELGASILIIQVLVFLLYNLVDSVFVKHKEAMTEKQKYKMEMKTINKSLEKTKDKMATASKEDTLKIAEAANNIIG